MNTTLDLERLTVGARRFFDAGLARALSPEILIDLAAIIITGLLALWAAPRLMRYLGRHLFHAPPSPAASRTLAMASSVAVAALWFVLLGLAIQGGQAAGVAMKLASSGTTLLMAWIVIRLLSNVVRSPFWARVIFITAWSLAALEIVGLLDRIEASLAGIGFSYGQVRISALNVVRAIIVLAILLWAAARLRAFLERRILHAQNLTPTLKVVFIQALKLVLPAIAVLVALPVLGVNLTAITVFGGALAVGIGLGLQKVVSNLVSGVLVLSSGSIRPGDVIAVKDISGGETYGRVRSISANYLSLETRAGKEHLIPNESFLTNGVENWTRNDGKVRLKIPFRITYGGDPKLAIKLALEAAATIPRVIEEPRPVCLLTAFGDSAIQLELRVWINDPMNGIANVKSECLLELWDRLKSADIRIVPSQLEVLLANPPEDRRVVMKESASRRA